MIITFEETAKLKNYAQILFLPFGTFYIADF